MTFVPAITENPSQTLVPPSEEESRNLGRKIKDAYTGFLNKVTFPITKKEIQVLNLVNKVVSTLPNIPIAPNVVKAYIPAMEAQLALAGFDPQTGDYNKLPFKNRALKAAQLAGESLGRGLLVAADALAGNTAETALYEGLKKVTSATTPAELAKLWPKILKNIATKVNNDQFTALVNSISSAQEFTSNHLVLQNTLETAIKNANIAQKIEERLKALENKPEVQNVSEKKQQRGEVASQVVKMSDAVCDGQNVKLGYIEKDEDGNDLNEAAKKQQAATLADKLSSSAAFGKKITGDEILALSQDVNELTGENGPFAGIYLVCLNRPDNPLASAVASVVFLQILRDLVKSNPDISHEEIINSGVANVDAVIKQLYAGKLDQSSSVDLAVSLVDKSGYMTSMSKNNAKIAVFGRSGNVKNNIAGGLIVETKLTFTDKVVLSSGDKISALTNQLIQKKINPKVKEMVDFIASSGQSAAAVEVTEAQAAQNVPSPAPVVNGEQATNGEQSERVYDENYPYYADLPEGYSLDEVAKHLVRTKTVVEPDGSRRQVEINYLTEVDGLLEKAKNLFVRKPDESDYDYHRRLLGELEHRVRFPNKWKNPAKQDELYRETKIKTDQEVLLMAIEAKRAFADREALQGTWGFNDDLHRREVHTEVSHNTAIAKVNDRLQKYFREKGEPAELPEDDLVSFTLIADILMDVKDPALGNAGATYREAFKKLEAAVETNPASNRELLELRRYFYRNAIDALASKELTIPLSPAATPQEQVLQDMRSLIQNLEYRLSQGTSADLLIGAYKGVVGGLQEGKGREKRKTTTDKVKSLLEKHPQVIVDMALKGGELMQRRARYEGPKQKGIPDKIYRKKFVQGPEEEAQETQKISPKGQPSTKKQAPPPAPAGEQPQEGSSEPTIPSEKRRMPPAPSSGTTQPPSTPGQPPQPTPEPLPTELRAAVVSAQQRVDRFNAQGELTQEGMQVLEERRREMGRLIMNEDRKKWEGRFSFLKQWIPRFWKYTLGDTATYSKESSHGLKLLAVAGINVTTLPYDVFQEVDKMARVRVAANRATRGQRFTGRLRDIGHELTFTTRDLHRERVKIVEGLRMAAEDPTSPLSQSFINELQQANQQNLLTRFNEVLANDVRAGEALARRINTKFGDELIHKVVGEKVELNVNLNTPEGQTVTNFLKYRVIEKLLVEGIRNNGQIPDAIYLQVNRDLQNFFLSKDFILWLDKLLPAQRQMFEESLSTVSDITALTRETLLPQVTQAWKSSERNIALEDYIHNNLLSNFNLSLNLGTLEAGQKGVIGEGVLERLTARAVTNERVHNLYQQVRTSTAPVYTPPAQPAPVQTLAQQQYQNYMNAAVNRSAVISTIANLGTSNVTLGLATGIGLYAAKATLGSAGCLAVPILGGSIVSGAFRAAQEHRLFTREWEEHNVERELNYSFPQEGRRRREMQGLELHHRRMEADLTSPMRTLLTRVDNGQITDPEILQLMGLVADTEARMDFSDNRGEKGLFSATQPQTYQVEKTNLEFTKAQAKVALRNLLTSNPTKLTALANQLGINFPTTGPNVDFILSTLRDTQIANIQNGTAATASQQLAFGNLSLTQAQSVDHRENAFRFVRARRDVGAFATTVAAGGVSYLLSEAASDLAQQAVTAASSWNVPALNSAFQALGLIHQEIPTGNNIVQIDNHLKVNLPDKWHLVGPVDFKNHQFTVEDAAGNRSIFGFTDDAQGGHIQNLVGGNAPVNWIEHSGAQGVTQQLSKTPTPLAVPTGTPYQEVAGIKFSLPATYHVTQTAAGVDISDANGAIHHFNLSFDANHHAILTPTDQNLIPHITETPGSPGSTITNSNQIEAIWKDQGLEQKYPGVKFWNNLTPKSDYQELQGYDFVFKNSHGQYGIVFDSSIMDKTLDPTTHQWMNVNNLLEHSKTGQAQFSFQLGGHHDSLKIDANFQTNKLSIDPSSDSPLTRDGAAIMWAGPDGTMAAHALTQKEFAGMLLNQGELQRIVNDPALNIHPGTSPDNAGSLASEWLENYRPSSHGASIFNLADNGKNGNISFGFTDQNGRFNYLANMSAKHAVEIATPAGPNETIANVGIKSIVKVKTVPTNQVYMSELATGEVFIPVLIPLSRRPLEAPKGKFDPVPPLRVPPGIPEPITSFPPYISGPLPAERMQLFDKNRSNTLKENPSAILDPVHEGQEYLKKQNPYYRQEIKQLAAQFESPPSPNLKAIVCIPVAGHQEGDNIYNTLLNFTNQDAPKDQYEVFLFVNYPTTNRDGSPVTPDKTITEIERFKKAHPDMPIRMVVKQLPNDQTKIGFIRKYGADLALYRNLQRGNQANDVILISNDADQKGIAPTYISNFISKFDVEPEVDGLLGQLDWDPEAYAHYPLVHLGTRLFQYLGIIGRNRSGRMPSSGANFAYRSSIYAAIGGYLPQLEGGEDVAVGQAIIAGRQNVDRIKFAGAKVSRLYTSARRAIKSLREGLAPVEQWNKGFSAFDDEVRRSQQGQVKDINFDDPSQLTNFKTDLEYILNRTIDSYEAGEKLGRNGNYYKTALRWLGIEYRVQNDKIVIVKMDSLIRDLKHYQKTGLLMREIKSHKGTPQELAHMKQELETLDKDYQQQLKEDEVRTSEELKKQDNETDNLLQNFRQEQLKLEGVSSFKYTLAELQASEVKVEEGDYVICRDKILGSGQRGQMVAGYNKKTGQICSFKTIQKVNQEFIAKANEYPTGILDLETYIKANSTNPTLGVNETMIDKGNSYIKVYPVSESDLDRYLEQQKNLSPENSLAIMIHLLDGVRDLHKMGIVHLDLSPTNILVNENGVKLIDFDAASIKNKVTNKYKRGFVGGFKHMLPPELFDENPYINENADTYEAGILFYKMVTGDYPYHTNSGTDQERAAQLKAAHESGNFTIPKNLPDSIKNILRKSIQPDQGKRYQNVDEMLKDIIEAYSEIKSVRI